MEMHTSITMSNLDTSNDFDYFCEENPLFFYIGKNKTVTELVTDRRDRPTHERPDNPSYKDE